MTLAAIARAYVRDCRPRHRADLHGFASQPSLREAVRAAALSVTQEGKRHPHQRRIPAKALQVAWEALRNRSLGRCVTFHELFEGVNAAIRPIRGIGPLAVYDIAQRIGAYLGLAPERVYLHAGTRQGARALGLDCRDRVLDRKQLPREWRKLSAAELEDCLCIYKRQLVQIKGEKS